MIVIKYTKQDHNVLAQLVAAALRENLVVAYPTDTSYGLAVRAGNTTAVDMLYKVKGRNFNKPIHVVPSSFRDIADVVTVPRKAKLIMQHSWPGPLTVVLPLLPAKNTAVRLPAARQAIRRLSAGSGKLGFRIPDNKLVQDIVHSLEGPMTATSANVSGKPDCYSAAELVAQYRSRSLKPDILIDAGRLPKRKPSTVIAVALDGSIELLRPGPISLAHLQKLK